MHYNEEHVDASGLNGQAASQEDEQMRKKREAEEKVAKMFASAKTPNKRAKKKASGMTYSDVPIAPKAAVQKAAAKTEELRHVSEKTEENSAPSEGVPTADDAVSGEEKLRAAEEKVAKMFADASISDKRDIKSLCSLPSAESPEQQEKNKTAEDKLEKIFAAAEVEKASSKKSSFSALVTEIFVLEFISLLLFFITMRSEMASGISLIAVLLPVIVGVGYRVLKQQLTLLEAISGCKLHIGVTCFFFLCIILSV